jgi:hypothetical protein
MTLIDESGFSSPESETDLITGLACWSLTLAAGVETCEEP